MRNLNGGENVYVYIYVCVCVCIYIYIYICLKSLVTLCLSSIFFLSIKKDSVTSDSGIRD